MGLAVACWAVDNKIINKGNSRNVSIKLLVITCENVGKYVIYNEFRCTGSCLCEKNGPNWWKNGSIWPELVQVHHYSCHIHSMYLKQMLFKSRKMKWLTPVFPRGIIRSISEFSSCLTASINVAWVASQKTTTTALRKSK